jgi:hypothetical protein
MMPNNQQLIAAVQQAMATQQAMANVGQVSGSILVFHPWTQREKWDYTRTVQFTLNLGGGGQTIVRGHVHYESDGNGGFNAGPGNYWISGVDNWSDQTPGWVVNANANSPGFGERQAAVNSYNHNHQTNYNVV